MRAYLGGRAVPRDEFALIGINESSDAPVILLLEDGDVFAAEDYISLGYTNFETWCVGAVGGRGGDATDAVKWLVSTTTEVMPDWVWADVVAYYNSVNGPSYVYTGTSPVGTPMPPHGVVSWTPSGGAIFWQLTPEGLAWLQNPNHIGQIVNWLEPIVQPGGKYIGGGGGGGGLHVVKGLLDDLPTEVIAAVGRQGDDGAPGQFKQAAPWDPSPVWSSVYSHMSQAHWGWANRFPNGHPTIDQPAEGSPGGASSFGDICQASGGKGGKPAIQWVGSTLQQYAEGGAGGIGGTAVISGGGAAGANTSTAPGKDGGWNGEVGAGGGGGRGGVQTTVQATEGGRGSLNYADTSVYGARGPLGTYLAMLRSYARAVVEAGGGPYLYGISYDVYVGALLADDTAAIAAAYNPGSGGGARIPGERKYGSRAVGYNHDGAVLVRLSKVD